jgi:hypothetical protein
VDPVDIIDTRFMDLYNLDLALPFFGDPTQFGGGSIDSSQPKGAFNKWLKIRSDANREAIIEFAGALSGDILFEPRFNVQDMPVNPAFTLLPWKPGSPIPTTALSPDDLQDKAPDDGYFVFQLGPGMSPFTVSRLYDVLSRHLRDKHNRFALDASTVPPEQLPKLLDAWFQAAP